MRSRTASRELVLILFSQLNNNIEKYKNEDFSSIVLKSVRTIISSSYDEVNLTLSELTEIKNQVIEYENNHPDNLSRPIDAENIPVSIKLTSDFISKIDILLSSAEKTLNALDVAELSALAQDNEVKDYILKIASLYKEHNKDVDNIIQEFSLGWDIDRIFKIDKDILRIAITELVYIKETPLKVVIDEALELAKKYSTDDSPSFINGILARVVEKYV